MTDLQNRVKVLFKIFSWNPWKDIDNVKPTALGLHKCERLIHARFCISAEHLLNVLVHTLLDWSGWIKKVNYTPSTWGQVVWSLSRLGWVNAGYLPLKPEQGNSSLSPSPPQKRADLQCQAVAESDSTFGSPCAVPSWLMTTRHGCWSTVPKTDTQALPNQKKGHVN